MPQSLLSAERTNNKRERRPASDNQFPCAGNGAGAARQCQRCGNERQCSCSMASRIRNAAGRYSPVASCRFAITPVCPRRITPISVCRAIIGREKETPAEGHGLRLMQQIFYFTFSLSLSRISLLQSGANMFVAMDFFETISTRVLVMPLTVSTKIATFSP